MNFRYAGTQACWGQVSTCEGFVCPAHMIEACRDGKQIVQNMQKLYTLDHSTLDVVHYNIVFFFQYKMAYIKNVTYL